MFLERFSPWENEQIAAIYEYLFTKVSAAKLVTRILANSLTSVVFNDIAEHDVEWGEMSIT